MSFPKARIQRFNECENDVPPPGAYDPKFFLTTKGHVIDKSERFHDGKSISSAECCLSVCTKSTSNLIGSFRTPPLPPLQPKKFLSKSCSKVTPRSIIPTKEKELKYKSQHRLADLQVECSNKNKTVQELEKYTENLKQELKILKLQLEESCGKQHDAVEQHNRDIEIMAKLQQDILNAHNEKYQSEVEILRCQLLEVSEEKQREMQVRKAIESDLRSQIAGSTEKITALESELADERHASNEKIRSLEIQIEELKMKLEKLIESHKYEVNVLEQEKFELNSSVKNLTDKLAECEEKLKRVIAENNEKANAMIMEAKSAVEEEMRVTTERYKSCLAQAELDRVALTEKLLEKDAEITRLSVALEELKSSADTQESFGQSLQMELDRAETQLAEKKEELRAFKDQILSEAAEIAARKHRFAVIMAENQSSVAALTNRLTQNNAEGERLQHELKRGEDCINEHRDLLNIMRNNSKIVHGQVHALMEELDAKQGLVNQLKADSSSEVQSMKSMFEAKIEDLEKIASTKVKKLQADCDAKDARNVETENQLHKMINYVHEVHAMLPQLEERAAALQLENSKLELLNGKLNKQLKENVALEEANKLLEGQSEVTLHEAQSKIQELSDEIKSLRENKTDIEEKTKLLKEEKSRREAAEEEVRKLAGYNERLKKDYEDISQKYAELVGHQNHRQRIKHLSQLKDKINQLEQDMRVKIGTIEQQKGIIEKLKAEERRTHIRGKENTLGISKNIIDLTSPVSSPQKPATPLRNRNE